MSKHSFKNLVNELNGIWDSGKNPRKIIRRLIFEINTITGMYAKPGALASMIEINSEDEIVGFCEYNPPGTHLESAQEEINQNWTFKCPFIDVINAACRVSGKSLDCDIHFGETTEDDALGETYFPADGGRIEVVIRPDMKIEQAMDILAHELAHVIAGEGDDHGPVWEKAYADIYEEYTRWYEERLKKEEMETENVSK